MKYTLRIISRSEIKPKYVFNSCKISKVLKMIKRICKYDKDVVGYYIQIDQEGSFK